MIPSRRPKFRRRLAGGVLGAFALTALVIAITAARAGAAEDAVVTRISKLDGFHRAEASHRDFLTLNPTYPNIVHNDMPKIENLTAPFPSRFSEKPALISTVKG